MKHYVFKVIGILFFLGSPQAYAAIASPVVNDYGDVFPTLSDVALSSSRTSDDAPWYVRFNLLAPANVAIGIDGRSYFGTFTVTSIRITEFDDDTQNIAFGTDSFTTNPFDPNPIDQLVFANNLAPNTYALAVSGSGDASGTDFITHLQVKPVPLPAGVWLFMSGLLGLLAVRRKV
ncbi:MAG: VPLPA-CTERM sorting domain-containing protein [Candidatus Thiodiazotropha sp. (ex Dulcina madagascariensis)]|nr:VPLPA-CTERM sorting domain-containing protein [Candidatus Thiodiazotropha sp. (ex Dulcina madagascariensis)]